MKKQEKVKKRRIRRFHFGTEVRIGFWIVLIGISAGFAFSMFKQISNNTETIEMIYNEHSSIEYNVCLFENEHIPYKCLSHDSNYSGYVANMIDYIDVDFRFGIDSSNLLDYSYRYSFRIKVIATDRTDKSKILYNETEVVVDNKIVTDIGNNIYIREARRIDYQEYNEMIQEFRREYNLSLDAQLVLTFSGEIIAENGDFVKNIIASRELSMTIPLSEQTFGIESSSPMRNEYSISEKMVKSTSEIMYIYLIYCLCLVFIILGIVNLLIFLRKIRKTKSAYEKTLDKIEREYNQILVESKKVPALENARIIDVNSFEELLDAREIVGKPILVITINSQKTWFLIVNGDEVYKFVLKAVDLENE